MRLGIGLGLFKQGAVSVGVRLFSAYKSRVIADGGTVEADNCGISALNNGLFRQASLLLIPSGYKSGKAYAEIPTNGNGDLTWTRASTALRTNSSGLLESMGSGVPRLSYMYGSCPALLLEPQRTNSIRNSTMVGASTSPSTLPTNYVVAGLTATVVGIGTENGLSYVDIRFNGTASGINTQLQLETTSSITASNGQTWTESVYLKLINTSTPPTGYNMRMREGTAAGVFVADGITAISPTTTLQRFTYTRTNTGALTERIQPILLFDQVSGNTYDYTIRIAQPQMELGAYATTPILTTTASATRVADVSRTTGLSSLIGQSEGTLFLDLYYLPLQNQSRGICVTETSNPLNNRLIININNTNNRASVISRQSNSNPNGSMGESASTVLLSGRNKIALGYKSGDSVLYINGISVATNTDSFTFSATLNDLFLMTSEISLVADNVGFVNNSALYKTRLSNSQLTTLTTL